MKKIASIALFSVTVLMIASDKNLFLNGDFENNPPLSEEMKQLIKKNKWDTDCVVFLRPGWAPAGKVHKMRMVDAIKEKQNVYRGNHSIMLESDGGHFFTSEFSPRGKYKLEFFVKGSGTFRMQTYIYGKRGNYLGHGKAFATVTAKNEWKKVSVVAEMGTEKDKCTQFTLALASQGPIKIFLDDITFTRIEENK